MREGKCAIFSRLWLFRVNAGDRDEWRPVVRLRGTPGNICRL